MCPMFASGAHLESPMLGQDSSDEIEPVPVDARREPHRHALLALHSHTDRHRHIHRHRHGDRPLEH